MKTPALLVFLGALWVAPLTFAAGITDAGFPMVDPKLDDPNKPWCYFTHPVTCIGMPWQPDPIGIQVTPEGNIYTGRAEFCLFWGDQGKPLASRQRRFLDGYIPVVSDTWSDGAIRYDYEVFGATLPGDPNNTNTAIFVKLTLRNTGTQPATAQTAAAFRQSGVVRRERDGGFDPNWRYAVRDHQLWRGANPDKLELVGIYPPPARWEAVNGTPYEKPFAGGEFGVVPRTEVGIARYDKTLAPGETMSLVFKFPRVPTADAKYLADLAAADYAACRRQVVDYWRNAVTRFSVIHTPGEPLIEESHRATAVHVMLATRTYGSGKTQTDGLPYPDLFLTTGYDYAALYESFGLPDFLRANFPQFTARQQADGLFVDTALSHGQKIFCGHGQPLHAIANHIVLSRDAALGKQYFPAIRKGVECIINDSRTQPHGLMRASIPYDNEMIKGQYTCHNYWSLIALRSAIRMARFLGEDAAAAAWLQFHDDYEALVLKAVRDSAAPDGYVPTGLYGFITGEAARGGFAEFRTDQDWENEMLLWPTELVQPGDPLVAGTLKRLRETKYREGIMTYRNGQHLHQYMTSRAANQFLLNGQPKEALIDTYHALLHSGAASESFENMIRPWTDRDVEFCPPPHAWGCSTYNGLVRNLFVMELGGRGGLLPGERDLLLLNAVSPAWLKPGEALGIEDAPTSFGLVTAMMTPRAGGADVSLKTKFHIQPRSLSVRIPYFVTLKSFTTNAKRSERKGDLIQLSPDATTLALEWTLNPDADKELAQSLLLRHRREPGFWPGKRGEMPQPPAGFLTEAERALPTVPLSFKLVLDTWKAEYARRFAEHIKLGGATKTFHPVAMQTPEERAQEGVIVRPIENLAAGKQVTCTPGSTHPEFANDGRISNAEFWECNTKDAWWQVDLGKATEISTLTVIPLHKDNRAYRFVVKTSMDGENWTVHIDKRDNQEPFGARGCEEKFQNTPMRHIRVEMFGNTLNEGNHLVELIAR
ncbi:MAG: discoidin domain-containing protein [Verrucomicrobia bacterium]|nr:discoidin domain-containing protein [Verrucomicrobiota bacterium]